MNETQTMLSRVADSLYWMSRYLERAEHTARLLDVYMNVILDAAPDVERRRLLYLQKSLASAPDDSDDADRVLQRIAFDPSVPYSIISCITTARENARQVREQISSEMWTQINRLYIDIRSTDAATLWSDSPHDFFLRVKEGSHLFQGITDATMNHDQGWHFIQLGRHVERSVNLLTLLGVHFDHTALMPHGGLTSDHYIELVSTLKSVSAFEAYCKVYNPNLQTRWINAFLLFDREFPRSLRFCVDRILSSLTALADVTGRSRNTRLYRLAGRLQSNLRYDEIGDVSDFPAYLANTKEQIGQIHALLFETYITSDIEMAV